MGKSFFRVGARLGIMMSGNEDDIRSDGDESNVISRCLPKTWCHQCKMRKQRVTACDNFFSSDKEVRCNGRYCDACILRHYAEDPLSFEHLVTWICYRCSGRCTCAACKRRRKADEVGEELGLDPQPRKREHRRFLDDSVVYDDDDDFEPSKRVARSSPSLPVPVMMMGPPDAAASASGAAAPTPPRMTMAPDQVPRLVEHASRSSAAVGMSALALLAEESLTSEFVPAGSVVPAMNDALELVNEHTEEIAKLKQLCLLLQMQVAKLTKHVGGGGDPL